MSRSAHFVSMVAAGDFARSAASLPPKAQSVFTPAAKERFISSMHLILVIAAVTAIVGAVLIFAIVLPHDGEDENRQRLYLREGKHSQHFLAGRHPTKRTSKMRISLGLLGTAAFMVIADARVLDPLLHIIADEFRAGVGSTAVVVTAYTVPYGLFQLIYGPLGDRIGKLKVMTAAMGLFALGTAACALVPNLAMLVILRFLTGTAAAGLIPLSLAYIGDNFPYEERQAAIGQYLGAIVLGQILGSSLGGVFGEYLSWRSIFLLFGVVSIGISMALLRATYLAPDSSQVQGRMSLAAFTPYFQLMTNPAARLVILAVFIEGFFFFGGFAYIGAFLRDRYSLSYVMIGFMLGGFGLGGLIYSRSVRWLVRRFGENGLITLGGWLICACYLSIAICQNWLLFIPSNILLGLGFYMLHSTLQTKATEMSPESRGTAVALFAFSLFIGQGIGAAALGLVVDGLGYTPSFVVAGVAIVLLTLWLVNQMRRLSQGGDGSSCGSTGAEKSMSSED